tara:strand:+ start:107 stop:1021 length:915 start_codon:yes stop_codon:yes gene_type:complete
MRIVLHGQQAFGKAVLEALKARGEEVVAVYVAPDKGERSDPLKEAANAHGIPVYQPDSYRQSAVWDQFKSLAPDLCVMAFVTLIVPEEFLNIPTKGSIQYHPSLLPRHRGPSSINWPIIQGETTTGLSIFWPDNGLDTGPNLLQKTVSIDADDTLGTLYFDKLFPMGVKAIEEAVDLVRDGKAPRIAQDESQATYEGWCRSEDVEIDWTRPATDVYNLIRGADPQPGAWTTFQGEKLQIFSASKDVNDSEGVPGEVILLSDEGFSVSVKDGSITVKRVRRASGRKVSAHEFMEEAGLLRGAQLG